VSANKGAVVAEDERIEEERMSDDEKDVEAHGARNVVAGGLAAAALIGGGVAATKLADGDPDKRTPAALSEQEEKARLADPKAADLDGDGYLTSAELAHEGFKWSVEELNRSGLEVSAPGLALAGFKHSPDLVNAEAFAIKGESIMLKEAVDENLDKLLEAGEAQEWSLKISKLDRDADGYAPPEELQAAGFKYDTSLLEEAGIKISEEELAKAGYRLPLHALGEGGFMIKGESVMLKHKVDAELDALVDKS
jgi:hypothetical protein